MCRIKKYIIPIHPYNTYDTVRIRNENNNNFIITRLQEPSGVAKRARAGSMTWDNPIMMQRIVGTVEG